jgi:hypothetical protein
MYQFNTTKGLKKRNIPRDLDPGSPIKETDLDLKHRFLGKETLIRNTGYHQFKHTLPCRTGYHNFQ